LMRILLRRQVLNRSCAPTTTQTTNTNMRPNSLSKWKSPLEHLPDKPSSQAEENNLRPAKRRTLNAQRLRESVDSVLNILASKRKSMDDDRMNRSESHHLADTKVMSNTTISISKRRSSRALSRQGGRISNVAETTPLETPLDYKCKDKSPSIPCRLLSAKSDRKLPRQNLKSADVRPEKLPLDDFTEDAESSTKSTSASASTMHTTTTTRAFMGINISIEPPSTKPLSYADAREASSSTKKLPSRATRTSVESGSATFTSQKSLGMILKENRKSLYMTPTQKRSPPSKRRSLESILTAKRSSLKPTEDCSLPELESIRTESVVSTQFESVVSIQSSLKPTEDSSLPELVSTKPESLVFVQSGSVLKEPKSLESVLTAKRASPKPTEDSSLPGLESRRTESFISLHSESVVSMQSSLKPTENSSLPELVSTKPESLVSIQSEIVLKETRSLESMLTAKRASPKPTKDSSFTELGSRRTESVISLRVQSKSVVSSVQSENVLKETKSILKSPHPSLLRDPTYEETSPTRITTSTSSSSSENRRRGYRKSPGIGVVRARTDSRSRPSTASKILVYDEGVLVREEGTKSPNRRTTQTSTFKSPSRPRGANSRRKSRRELSTSPRRGDRTDSKGTARKTSPKRDPQGSPALRMEAPMPSRRWSGRTSKSRPAQCRDTPKRESMHPRRQQQEMYESANASFPAARRPTQDLEHMNQSISFDKESPMPSRRWSGRTSTSRPQQPRDALKRETTSRHRRHVMYKTVNASFPAARRPTEDLEGMSQSASLSMEQATSTALDDNPLLDYLETNSPRRSPTQQNPLVEHLLAQTPPKRSSSKQADYKHASFPAPQQRQRLSNEPKSRLVQPKLVTAPLEVEDTVLLPLNSTPSDPVRSSNHRFTHPPRKSISKDPDRIKRSESHRSGQTQIMSNKSHSLRATNASTKSSLVGGTKLREEKPQEGGNYTTIGHALSDPARSSWGSVPEVQEESSSLLTPQTPINQVSKPEAIDLREESPTGVIHFGLVYENRPGSTNNDNKPSSPLSTSGNPSPLCRRELQRLGVIPPSPKYAATDLSTSDHVYQQRSSSLGDLFRSNSENPPLQPEPPPWSVEETHREDVHRGSKRSSLRECIRAKQGESPVSNIESSSSPGRRSTHTKSPRRRSTRAESASRGRTTTTSASSEEPPKEPNGYRRASLTRRASSTSRSRPERISRSSKQWENTSPGPLKGSLKARSTSPGPMRSSTGSRSSARHPSSTEARRSSSKSRQRKGGEYETSRRRRVSSKQQPHQDHTMERFHRSDSKLDRFFHLEIQRFHRSGLSYLESERALAKARERRQHVSEALDLVLLYDS
jgi:hypothetical protein